MTRFQAWLEIWRACYEQGIEWHIERLPAATEALRVAAVAGYDGEVAMEKALLVMRGANTSPH